MEGSTEIHSAPLRARAGRESPGVTPPPAAESGLRLVVGRHQLPLFLLLTALISWAFVLPTGGMLLPYGPTLAAGVVLAAVAGRRGVADLWRQTSRWRVGWRWYLIAPGLIGVAHLGALGLSLALGAEVVNTAHLRSLPAYLAAVGPLVLVGGQWEEPGWLGYLLPRLQARLPRPLVAAAAAGGVRVLWHTPLLLYGWIPWYDYLFGIFALQLCLTWLYHRTGRSVLLPMVCHLTSNVALATLRPVFGGADQGAYWLLYTAALSALALGLVLATRGTLGRRLPRSPTPVSSA